MASRRWSWRRPATTDARCATPGPACGGSSSTTPTPRRTSGAALERLAIDTSSIASPAADFAVDDVAGALAAVGHVSTTPTLFTVEGVAVYLDRPVLEALLRGLRQAAAPGSRLAISLSVDRGADTSATRAAFRSVFARLGEPARTTLTVDEAADLIHTTGWRDDGAGRSQADPPASWCS